MVDAQKPSLHADAAACYAQRRHYARCRRPFLTRSDSVPAYVTASRPCAGEKKKDRRSEVTSEPSEVTTVWILSPRLLCHMLHESHHLHVYAVRAHVLVFGEWFVRDVSQWLQRNGFAEYACAFAGQQIDTLEVRSSNACLVSWNTPQPKRTH